MIAAIVVAPIVVGLLLYLMPRRAELAAKWIGVLIAFASVIAVVAFADLPDETAPWFAVPFAANFHFGLGHGPGTWIALLLGVVTGCALMVTRVSRQRDFVAQMMILLGAMLGVFLSRDLLLFALFWDLQLIPVFLILIGWTATRTKSAAWRYLVYNLVGGLALLLATAAFGAYYGTTDPFGAELSGIRSLPAAAVPWIFLGFAFAFLIKTPVWPFHTWMPDTYAELPPAFVAVVSSVQSKGGLYGIMFVGLGLTQFVPVMHEIAPLTFVLGGIGLLYGAVVALVQDDAKRVVAYSSLSHLGLILIAIFSFNPIALGGAVVYIVAHGLFSAGAFIVLGEIELREETRLISRLGGLGARNPRLAGALTIVILAALGLPGLCGFAGEILILTGVYRAGYVWATAIALVAVLIAAAYMLRLFQGMMQGPEVDDLPQREDMTPLEIVALAPIVLAIVLLGIAPGSVASAAPVLPPVSTAALAPPGPPAP